MDAEHLQEIPESVQEGPTVHRLADDLVRVRMPLPFALDHVNGYLIRDGAGWAVIDTGLNTSPGRATWAQVWEMLAIAPTDITRILVTHAHPDHLGMAGWLQSVSHAPVLMSIRTQEAMARIWEAPVESWRAETELYLRRNGLDPTWTERVLAHMADLRSQVHPLPQTILPVRPGDVLEIGRRRFRLLAAEGHADDQVLFYEERERLLWVGDQVLLEITPNIGTWPATPPDPLGRYLASLQELAPLPVALALPGHRAPVLRFPERIAELQTHHAHRLEAVWQAVDEAGSTTYQVAQRVFPLESYPIHQVRFAIAETLAHLERLAATGRIHREDDPQGVWRFHRVGSRRNLRALPDL